MKHHVYVRPLRMHDEADKAAFIKAVEGADKFFPANVLTLPTVSVMVAERREEHGVEVVMYQVMYPSLVMGSLIPVGSDVEVASAMHQMTAAAYMRANAEGFGDVLMFSDTPETVGFAARHGFEKAHEAYRLEVR